MHYSHSDRGGPDTRDVKTGRRKTLRGQLVSEAVTGPNNKRGGGGVKAGPLKKKTFFEALKKNSDKKVNN